MTQSPHAMSPLSSSSPQPDPSTDAPTVWMPPSAGGAGASADGNPDVASESGRNVLALVSLIASLFFPLAVAINLGGAALIANHLISQRAFMVFAIIGGVLDTIGLPAMITAIVTGHVALVIARRFTRHNARRWMAITGLVVGYLSLIGFLGVVGLFLAAGMNGF